jgi:hypothetical protein
VDNSLYVCRSGTINHEKLHRAKHATKEEMNSNATEHGHLTLTNVKKISGSCDPR